MSGRNVNIYFQEKNYNQLKDLIAERKISEFVNKAIEKELEQEKKERRERLIAAYQRVAKNKKLQKELSLWEKTASDGLNNE